MIYLAGYTAAREAAQRYAEQHGDWVWSALSWGSMVYGCAGDTREQHEAMRKASSKAEAAAILGRTHFERRVELGLGVEGPRGFRDAKTYIPAPYIAGRCEVCGGALSHVRWEDDQAWEPRPRDPSLAFFVVPSGTQAKRRARQGYGGAELVEPGQGGPQP